MQAIAAMMRAQEADPSNLEVLLALGVSHTNGQCLKSSNMCLLHYLVAQYGYCGYTQYGCCGYTFLELDR